MFITGHVGANKSFANKSLNALLAKIVSHFHPRIKMIFSSIIMHFINDTILGTNKVTAQKP